MEKLRIEYFNDEELTMISNALLSAISNCEKAYALVNEEGTKKAINKEYDALQKLNIRVCELNRILYGEV